jgi:hypothetical protein
MVIVGVSGISGESPAYLVRAIVSSGEGSHTAKAGSTLSAAARSASEGGWEGGELRAGRWLGYGTQKAYASKGSPSSSWTFFLRHPFARLVDVAGSTRYQMRAGPLRAVYFHPGKVILTFQW